MADDGTIDVGVRGGREAKALVDAVTQALRLLGLANAANTRQATQAAQAGKTQADTLRGIAKASQESLARQQELLRQLKLAADATAASSAKAKAEALDAAKTYAKAATEAAKYFQTVAAGRLKEAQKGVTTVLPSGGTVTVVSDALVAARRRELAAANESLARAKALGRQQIQNADQVGAAETRSARQRVQAQQAVVTATQKAAQQNAAAARQAEATAAAQERAAKRATSALITQNTATNTIDRASAALRATILRLVAAYSGFRAIEGFVAAGLRFNTVIESSKLGIGALITATSKLEDSQGNLITGTAALAVAQGLAKGQLDKLRIAGIQTAATTEDLVTTFEEAVGAGLAVGLTLDQIRKFSISVAQAAAAIHLPMNQLQQETRSILQGTIDRNSRIAKALSLTNAEVNLAKQQGRLADLLNEKFKAFNIAGVESVKTFAALRSNIQDAFSVLAGQATFPLFEQLRKAGLEALSGIFDFRSAEIQRSFKGLVEGAAVVFKEIGEVLADAIAFGVERARTLSEFLARNKEEVKATAAAIATMVRTFGEMIGSITATITGIVTMGREVNTVTAIARTLNDIFELIRDNIGKILLALALGKLVTTLSAVIGLVLQLRAAAGAAAVGTVLGGPGIGTAIGGLVGLLLAGGAALKLFKGHQEEVRLEAARLTTTLDDQVEATAALVRKYTEIQRAAQAKGVSDEELITLQGRLKDVLDELGKQGGTGAAYLALLRDQKLAHGENTKAINEQIQALIQLQTQQAAAAFLNVQSAQQELKNMEDRRAEVKKVADATVDAADLRGRIAQLQARDELKTLDTNIEAIHSRLRVATEQAQKLHLALKDTIAATQPITVKPIKTPTTEGGESPVIKAAQAALDAERARLDVERAKINRDFAAHVVDATERLQQLLKVDIAEINAEEKFLEARQKEAERKLRAAPVGKTGTKTRQAAQDELNAVLIARQSLGLKEQQLVIDEATAEIKIRQDQADKEAEIHIRALKARGQTLDAALQEITLKERQALRELDDETGQRTAALQKRLQDAIREGVSDAEIQRIRNQLTRLLTIRAEVTVAIRHETIEGSIKAIKEEIDRILTARTREVEGIRDRFKLSGKLSADERQQQADLIAQANQRALDSTAALRAKLLDLKLAAAGDPALQTEAQILLDQLANLSVRAQEVNQELERLKDGAREAFEHGIGSFLEGLGDRTKGIADGFRDMVSSIIKDLQRLASQLLAQRIVTGFLRALAGGGFNPSNPGLAGADQAGNIIIPGLAKGGPSPYGRLRGGIPGVDSIPVLAQQDEWFLRPQVRRKYGDAYLRALNELRAPLPHLMPRQQIVQHYTQRFAQGGPVNVPTSARIPVEQAVTVSGMIGVDRHGLLSFVQGPVMKGVVKDHVKSSSRELGRVLSPQRQERR